MTLYICDQAGKKKSKHCIIFDLDQTLIATQEDIKLSSLTDQQKIRLGPRIYNLTTYEDGSPYCFWGVLRPGVEELLRFCFDNFMIVGVWSAGTKGYVEEIVNFIFHEKLGRIPHIVFTRDDIVERKDTSVGKPLDKMYQHNEVFQRYMNPKNTIIIDDNPKTAIFNRSNVLMIPPYEPETVEEMLAPDNTLMIIKNWLNREDVRNSPDLRTVVKDIFRN